MTEKISTITAFDRYLLDDETIIWLDKPNISLVQYIIFNARRSILGYLGFPLSMILASLIKPTELSGVIQITSGLIFSVASVASIIDWGLKFRNDDVRYTSFAITEKRILVLVRNKLHSWNLSSTLDITLWPIANGVGTLQFQFSDPVFFYCIADVQGVYDLLKRIQRNL